MADSKTVEILLKFGLDAAAAKQAAAQLDDIGKKGKGANEHLKEGSKAGDAFSNALKGAASAAAGFLTIGKAISEIGNAVNAYVGQVGESEEASRRWLKATEEVNDATVDVGRTLTSILIPAAELYRDIMKSIPDLLTGKGVPVVETAEKAAAILRLKAAQALPDDQPLPGKVAAFVDQGKSSKQLQIDAAQAAVDAIDAKYKIQDENRAKGLNPEGTGPLGGGTPGAGTGVITPANITKDNMSYETAMRMKAFYTAEIEAKRAADYTKMKMDRDFNIQQTYALLDYNKSVFRANRDFEIQRSYSEKDFYRQRSIAARDFGIQMVRSEQDFQRSRLRAGQDHEFDLYQIALSGDAMSYWLAERSYKIQQDRAKEDFEIQKGRSKEDFDRSQADAEREYQIQRERELAAFRLRLADQELDYNIQRERAIAAHELAEKDLQYSLDEQKRLRKNALEAEKFAVQDHAVALQKIKDAYSQIEMDNYIGIIESGLDRARVLIENSGNGGGDDGGGGGWYDPNYTPTKGAYAAGGYTNGTGPALVHSGEFMLTASTTSAAERVAKGRLSQEAILQMLFSGGKGGATVNQIINTDVSSETRKAMMDDARTMLLEVM